MFHFAGHERIGILLEDTQAGVRTKIDSFTLINGAGIIRGVFEFASAGGFIFREWGGIISQSSVFLVMCIVVDIPGAKHEYSHSNAE